jgi:hypothetical protein
VSVRLGERQEYLGGFGGFLVMGGAWVGVSLVEGEEGVRAGGRGLIGGVGVRRG